MARATWEGAVLAESNDTVIVEGNHYFPGDSIDSQYFKPSSHQSVCFWKGAAGYYHLEVNGKRNVTLFLAISLGQEPVHICN